MATAKEDDREQRGWWASGEYICNCRRCKDFFIGDKRSAICADCAYSDEEKKGKAMSDTPRTEDLKLCFTCGGRFSTDSMTLDEGDAWFCERCVRRWEQENRADFVSGQEWPEAPKVEVPVATLVSADFATVQERIIAQIEKERDALKAEVERLTAWIVGLDELARNDGEDRKWMGGEIGWVYPGHAAYYGDLRPIEPNKEALRAMEGEG